MYEHELPTLSQINDWDVQHLVDAAAHWTKTADLWEETFHSAWQSTLRPGGTEWGGEAADSAQDLTWRDLVRVRGSAESLRTVARIAHTGAESLCDVKRLALNAIDDARSHGFVVDEDLSVSAPPDRTDGHPLMMLRTAADEDAADIKHFAANLVALDHDIARRLHNAAISISEGIPYLARGCA
jgi:hypothetical protein